MVERFNQTLKAMLCWLLWQSVGTTGYCGCTEIPPPPHETKEEKPSFLLFGMDCHSPTEALPLKQGETEVTAYREELIESLCRRLAAETIQKAQTKYKMQYDCKAKPDQYRIGEWVLIKFPSEESGKQRKLSKPWHPYRIME